MALSWHLKARARAAGVEPSLYPTPAALRRACQLQERLHASAKKAQTEDALLASHSRVGPGEVPHPVEAALHEAVSQSRGQTRPQEGDEAVPLPVRVPVAPPHQQQTGNPQ